MRRSLPLAMLAAAAVLVLVAAFAGVGRPEAARGDTGPPNTVTTNGHGVVTAVPDEATVTAGVHTQAASAADALSRNSTLMNRVVEALRQAKGTDLQTQQVSLAPQTNEEGRVTGYVADDTVSAKAKVADAGALVDAAVRAGANTVGGPSLGISDTDTRYRQALGKAVEDARAKAQALADAGGFGVGPVSSVSEQSANAPVPVFQAAAAKSDATPIEPGTQDVTADVIVTFTIR